MEEMNYFGFENGDEYEIADKKAREGVDKLNSNLSQLSKIKKSIIGDGINDLYGTIYFNDNKFPVDIRIVGNTKASNSSYEYLSFEIGVMDFGVGNENAKHFTDQSFDETFTIPSGSYLAFLNQRNVTSNFEIYSSSVVSNVINNVNDSLTNVSTITSSVSSNYGTIEDVKIMQIGLLSVVYAKIILTSDVNIGNALLINLPRPLSPNSGSSCTVAYDRLNKVCHNLYVDDGQATNGIICATDTIPSGAKLAFTVSYISQ